MKHTAQCEASHGKAAQFRNMYPNLCTKCGGLGVISVVDYVPYGMGNTAMPSEEPCPDCEGFCPRCGEEMSTKYMHYGDKFSCRNCGWDEEQVIGIPEVDCSCWEDDEMWPMEFQDLAFFARKASEV